MRAGESLRQLPVLTAATKTHSQISSVPDLTTIDVTRAGMLRLAEPGPGSAASRSRRSDGRRPAWLHSRVFGAGAGLSPPDLPGPIPGLRSGPRLADVPVDGFWSASVYNRDGCFGKNEFESYGLNDVTAEPNKDGSFTVNFGDCSQDRERTFPKPEPSRANGRRGMALRAVRGLSSDPAALGVRN